MSTQKIEDVYQIDNKLVQTVIAQIFLIGKNIEGFDGLPRLHIHKFLYKVKNELSESNPIKDYIPFYWYMHGPFSEVININIDDILVGHQKGGYELLDLRKGFEKNIGFPKDKYFEEFKDKLKTIVKPKNLFKGFYMFRNNIYRDAPCPFIYIYDYFKNNVRDYSEKSQLTLYEASGIYDEIDKLENILYKCENELPSEYLFKHFNDSFSSFVTGATRVFNMVRKDGKSILYSKELLPHTTDIIWETFAYGARILYHDRYYKNRLKDWEYIYNNSLFDLQYHVDNFNTNVLKEIRNRSTGLIVKNLDNLDDISKNVLSSVVDSYLR